MSLSVVLSLLGRTVHVHRGHLLLYDATLINAQKNKTSTKLVLILTVLALKVVDKFCIILKRCGLPQPMLVAGGPRHVELYAIMRQPETLTFLVLGT
jgi:hypothetical protein